MMFVRSLASSTLSKAARRTFLSFCCVLALASVSAREAHASLVGIFQNFSLTNSPFANGYADTFNGDLSLLFTGPNDGSGLDGTTDLTEVVAGNGMFHFSYAYASLDGAGNDFAGYLLNGSFFSLADTDGQSGTVNLPVSAGQIVGFRIATLDNWGEPGIMTITDFSSPAPATATAPEPGACSLVLLAIALGAMVRRPWRTVRIGRIRGGTWLTAAAVVAAAVPLSAQTQVEYTGTNVTGRLAFVRVVNLRQQSLVAMQALKMGAVSAEPRPKMPEKLLRPPFSKQTMLGAVSLLGAVSMRSLTLSAPSGVSGFNALSHADQRNASSGNQFSIEPPNPSIAASNDYLLEGVNNAVQIYYPSGVAVLPRPLSSNQVFGLAPAIDRNTGVNGVYLTDMRVYFDQGMSRWFVVQRSQDNDVAGNELNSSHLYVAVSKTADPAGDYNIYVMDTTNQNHIGCPCVADYPQIGSDQYGFHIAFNEFNFNFPIKKFVDAGILTLSKASLLNGAPAPTAYMFLLPYNTGYEFAIQPAATPPGASNAVASGGIEFFASTVSAFASGGAVALWAMRNTSSMATSNPSPILSQIVVSSLPYSYPDVAVQSPGALPYGWSLSPTGQLPFLDGGDCRVQALSYASGRLYLTFPTGIADETGRYGVGGAYVVISPTYRNGVLAGSVLNQGYLLVNGNHLLRPAIAVNAQGRGTIAATLVGATRYPSAALIPFDTFSTPLSIQVAGEGTLPEDGFTGYPDGGGSGAARWGDYNTAVATSDGAIWMVVEYIGSYPRTEYANWNTYVMRKQP